MVRVTEVLIKIYIAVDPATKIFIFPVGRNGFESSWRREDRLNASHRGG